MSILHDTSDFPTAGRVVGDDKWILEDVSTISSITETYNNYKNLNTRSNEEEYQGKGLFWTCDASHELPVRISKSALGAIPPVTVMEQLANAVSAYGDSPALSYHPASALKGPWITYTWQDYWNNVCHFGKSLLKLGIKPGGVCAIMGYNSPFWIIGHIGTIFTAGISSAIYPTSNSSAAAFILKQTEAIAVLVDTKENADKILSVKHTLPYLRLIIMYYDDVTEEYESKGVISIHNFLKMGHDITDAELADRMNLQVPEKCCSIIYTSGTTGIPKGAMLSHDNVTWTGYITSRYITKPKGRIVSFLPLSHIAAQVLDIYLPLCAGHHLFFSNMDALRGSLITTLKDVRPTWFLGVPRVYEKMEIVLRNLLQGSVVKKNLFRWAMKVEYNGAIALLENKKPSSAYWLVHSTITHKVRKALGFDQCEGFGTCAAPISRSTQEFFLSLGMPVCDIYGLSETTGPMTFSACSPGWYQMGSIGHTINSAEVALFNLNEKGVGEVCFRGRNCFMGYYKNEPETLKTIDKYGFLHTGDTGYIDSNGFVVLIGRLKELLITAGGENVAPVPLEEVIKKELPFISNCQIIGDKRKFLSVLLCLKSVLDAKGKPTTNLEDATLELLKKHGSTKTKTTYDAQSDKVLNKLIQEGIERANSQFPSRAQHIQKWTVLVQDFTEDGGELTSTLKLKRSAVIEKYKKVIDKMYQTPTNPANNKYVGSKL